MKAIQAAKAQARILKKFLLQHELPLTHGLALEAVARLHHHKSWAEFLAAEEKDALFLRRKTEVRDWPVLTFSFKPEGEEGLDDVLHVLPAYATLDSRWTGRYGSVWDTDAVCVEALLAKAGSRIVVKAMQSCVPRVDKYGLPWFANEETVTEEVKENLGFAALSPDDGGVDMSFHETGDDSSAKLWFEAYVEPQLAAELKAEYIAQAGVSLEVLAYRRVFEGSFGPESLELDVATVMNSLADGLSASGNADAGAYLSSALGQSMELNAPLDNATVREVNSAFKRLAKVYYEELLLSQR